ncbi:RedV protein [Streptomyces sp. AN091965]|uniref:RedV protein n=1 Tax=Streptomyces sp. AN091965 TaxID=2927803 RepID=UPI001F623A43|nr:RedV protein [Streptomyces sp. AN091965]MCI3934237.1 RedV protein [Streptomyces sp. AN091965]
MTADWTRAPRTAAPAVPTEPGFEAALDDAVRVAALSPSSHNCQPWAVAWARGGDARAAAARAVGGTAEAADQYLVLALDRERRLRALPALHVEMLISCGAYAQLLLRALGARGWTVDALRYAPGALTRPLVADWPWARPGPADWPRTWAPLGVARLRHEAGGAAEDPRALRATAAARRTHRAPYRREPVAPEVLDRLAAPTDTALARDADVSVRHLTSDADRAALAAFVARHAGRDFSHGPAWRETHSYLRFSAADAAARGDGFTLEELFGPLSRPHERARRLALAPTTMRLLRHVGYPGLLARQLARIVRPTPALAVLSLTGTRPPTLADGVKGGARVADYWLAATVAGLALHPISAVLQHDDLRRALEDRFRIPGQAIFLSRLGRPTTGVSAFPRSHRRPAHAPLRTI